MKKILLALSLTTAILTTPAAFAMEGDAEDWWGTSPTVTQEEKVDLEAREVNKWAGYEAAAIMRVGFLDAIPAGETYYSDSRRTFSNVTLFEMTDDRAHNIEALIAQNNYWTLEINALEAISRGGICLKTPHHVLKNRTVAAVKAMLSRSQPRDQSDGNYATKYHEHRQHEIKLLDKINKCQFITSPESLQEWITARKEKIAKNDVLIAQQGYAVAPTAYCI